MNVRNVTCHKTLDKKRRIYILKKKIGNLDSIVQEKGTMRPS